MSLELYLRPKYVENQKENRKSLFGYCDKNHNSYIEVKHLLIRSLNIHYYWLPKIRSNIKAEYIVEIRNLNLSLGIYCDWNGLTTLGSLLQNSNTNSKWQFVSGHILNGLLK